jgi:tRNA A-37 threonylcarbamoyl transferase component Bud32
LNGVRIADSYYLSTSGRNVEIPFRVLLETDNRHIELTCSRILRILPGKRLVCSGEYNGQDVVVKFFLDSRRAKKHCAREEKGIRALKEAGLKTQTLLLKGLIKPGCEPVLVFRMIDRAINFADVWKQVTSDNTHAKLLRQIVLIIADQHEAGLTHDDLHMGNFILAGNDIYTIDGDAVNVHNIGNPLSETKSLENLGLFFAKIYPRFDRLVPDAFNMYLEKRAWSKNTVLYNRLTKEIRHQYKKNKKKYLKRIYRECSAFSCQKSWNRFLVYNRNYDTEKMVGFLADPDVLIDRNRLLKNGNTATVALVEVDSQRLVVKRYNIKNAWHALRRCLRPSRAWNSWRNAHRLAILGIPTPKPIALLEKRWGPFRSKAYFITEYVDGINLYHLFHYDKVKEIQYQELVKQFGELLQQFANAFISHGDFKATNFIFSGGELIVTDLDGMHEHRFKCRFRKAFSRDLNRFMQNWTDLSEVDNIFREKIKNIKL